MRKFEYMVRDFEIVNEHNLNQQGKDGWELVGFYRGLMIYKREL